MSTVTDLESYQQFAQQQQAANNAWSAEQAQKQMDFQKMMSDTSHQREVADLKAAGLNPILSANSGAQVTQGAQAEGDRSTAGNVGNVLQQVLQAQSAREVAGMYNAATIAAATIAANASMYGSDMMYESAEDHPNSVESVMARMLKGVVSGIYDGDSVSDSVAGFVDKIKNPIPADDFARSSGFKKGSVSAALKKIVDTVKSSSRKTYNSVNSASRVSKQSSNLAYQKKAFDNYMSRYGRRVSGSLYNSLFAMYTRGDYSRLNSYLKKYGR